MITSYAVWCWAGSVQWVYQSLFTENSQLLLLLLLLETTMVRAVRLN